MAAKILANLLIASGTVLARAAVQAYRQALVNGARAGVNAQTVKDAAKVARGAQMSAQEARQVLGIDSGATWEQISKKYDHLMAANEKHGSFYLQSKVYRAREALEQELGPPPPGSGGGEGEQQQQQQQQ